MKIVTMEPWHLIWVVMHLPPETRALFGTAYQDADPQVWACKRALMPGVHLSTIVDGLPVACFGISDEAVEGVGTAWLIFSNGAQPYAKSMKRAFDVVVKSGAYRAIQAGCVETDRLAKYFKWLGFKRVGTIKAYCCDGRPLDLYQLEV